MSRRKNQNQCHSEERSDEESCFCLQNEKQDFSLAPLGFARNDKRKKTSSLKNQTN